MKIVAQSLVPSNPLPYLHLGYLSAMTTELPSAWPISTAIIWATILSLGVLIILRKYRSLSGGLLMIGITLAGIAAVFFTQAIKGPLRYVNPTSATRGHILRVTSAIKERLARNETIPSDIHAFNLLPKDCEDGWYQPLIINKGKKTEELYIVSSAGPDGRHSTVDDISRAVTKDDLQELKRRMKETGR
ncbi:MAG: hypothetical protein ACYDBB_16040 [Armatimonadota bacterium]